MKERIPTIDTARGIAIILVVIGHSISYADEPINTFILSFHMPLFFVISGMTVKLQPPRTNFLEYVIHKSKRLLLPQVFLGFILYMYYGLLVLYQTGEMTLFEPLNLIKRIIEPWFLIVMFQITIVSYVYRRWIISSKSMSIVFNLLILSLCFFMVISNFSTKYGYVHIVPVGWVFYIIGLHGRQYLLAPLAGKREYMIILSLAMVFCLSQINTPVKMYTADYGIFPLFLITSLLGSISIIRLCQRVSSPLLTKAGVYSMIIYVFQFPCTMLFFVVSTILCNRFELDNESLRIGLNILLALPLLSILTIYSIRNRIMRYIFGLATQNNKGNL